jgi:predicted TIM-barrel fold metal-dependent hydrolase
MSACRPKRGSITKAIQDGIAKRGFYIVSTPEDVPGCRGKKSEFQECVHEFARENGWHVAIHSGNGWLLFTPSHTPPAAIFESDLGPHEGLIDSLLQGARPLAPLRA